MTYATGPQARCQVSQFPIIHNYINSVIDFMRNVDYWPFRICKSVQHRPNIVPSRKRSVCVSQNSAVISALNHTMYSLFWNVRGSRKHKNFVTVTLDSGRGKRRLETRGTRVPWRASFKGARMLGASAATRVCLQRSTHSEVARRLRDPEDKGKSSRFKLEKSTRDIVALYKCVPSARTKQCS